MKYINDFGACYKQAKLKQNIKSLEQKYHRGEEKTVNDRRKKI